MADDDPRSITALPDLRHRPGGVAGHVGAVLVDDADHPERHPHPLDPRGRWAGPIRRPPRRPGSGRAATWRSPSAMAATRSSVQAQPVERGGIGSRPLRPAPHRRRWPSRMPLGPLPRAGQRPRSSASSRAADEARARSRPACPRPPAEFDHRGGRAGRTVSAYLPRRRITGTRCRVRLSPARPGRRGGPLRGARPRAARRSGGPAHPATVVESVSHQALGEDRAVGADDLHRVVDARMRPATDSTPAGSSDRPRSTRARRAPASTTMVPEAPMAKAIHSLRAGSRRSWGRKRVPTPACRPESLRPAPRVGRRRR